MVGELDGVHKVNVEAQALQGENTTAVPDIAVNHMALNAQNSSLSLSHAGR